MDLLSVGASKDAFYRDIAHIVEKYMDSDNPEKQLSVIFFIESRASLFRQMYECRNQHLPQSMQGERWMAEMAMVYTRLATVLRSQSPGPDTAPDLDKGISPV